ncbi:hypothetical protein CHS0354_025312 [Potamilus streckersoni]|uniref:Phosphorylated adapter RNA export protein n=1 Tax=Potamilus streckersoni TaxID=2493646 RepID=A0AAE0VJJ8_9BIVA|nr:hypothetical protein CHS0354_025312 [Potamilus streckersoni]
MADLEDGEIVDSGEEDTQLPSNGSDSQNASNYSTLRVNAGSEIAHTSISDPRYNRDLGSCQQLDDSPAYRCSTPNASVSSSDSANTSDEDTSLWRQKKEKYFRYSNIETHKQVLMDLAPELPSLEYRKEKDTNSANRKFNNVWGSVLQEQTLTQNLSACGVEQPNAHTLVERDVESYDYKKKYTDNRPRAMPVVNDDSLGPFDKVSDLQEVDIYPEQRHGKKRKAVHNRLNDTVKKQFKSISNKIEITAEDSETDVINTIAGMLNEPKIELIERIIETLGKGKAIELLHLTKRTEECGGMLTLDGTRRRTPGGVYIQLMKTDKNVTNQQKKQIFKEEYDARNKARKEQRKRNRKIKNAQRHGGFQNQKVLDGSRGNAKKEKAKKEAMENEESESDSNAEKSNSDLEVDISQEPTKKESCEDLNCAEEDIIEIGIGDDTID